MEVVKELGFQTVEGPSVGQIIRIQDVLRFDHDLGRKSKGEAILSSKQF